jgi:hypothetical protein
MLIISAQEEIFESVVEMVERLDEEARPRTTVAVHRVSGTVQAQALQKALSEAIGRPWPGGRPEKQQQAEGDGQDDENERNGRENGERRNREQQVDGADNDGDGD